MKIEDEGQDDVLKVQEIAERLKCSKSHVFKLMNGRVKGVKPLPSIQIMRTKIVFRSALERWMKENERTVAHR